MFTSQPLSDSGESANSAVYLLTSPFTEMNMAGQTLVFMDGGIFYGLVMLLGRCWSTSFLKCALVINGVGRVSEEYGL